MVKAVDVLETVLNEKPITTKIGTICEISRMTEQGKLLIHMVGAKGIEPLASSASRKRSPTELRAFKCL
jgi:hypothetical protein